MSTKPRLTLPPHTPPFARYLAETVDTRGEDGKPVNRLRKGNSSIYYALPGTDAYVLRLEAHALSDKTLQHDLETHLPALLQKERAALGNKAMQFLLQHYTSLTPPEDVIVGANIGQPLLTSRGNVISIQRRQPGEPVTEYLQHKAVELGFLQSLPLAERNHIRMRSHTKVMHEILGMGWADTPDDPSQPLNPFIPLFEQAYELAYMGYQPDFYLHNIFIDSKGKKLGLVNQLSEFSSRHHILGDTPIELVLERQLTRALSGIRIETPSKDDDGRAYEDAFVKLSERMHAAKNRVLYNHSYGQPQSKPSLAFGQVKDTSAVAMETPTRVLMEHLRTLQNSPAKTGHYF